MTFWCNSNTDRDPLITSRRSYRTKHVKVWKSFISKKTKLKARMVNKLCLEAPILAFKE